MGRSFCLDVVSPRPDVRAVLAYGLAMGLPALGFLLFLGWKAHRHMPKLRRSQSQIMATYYAFLWLVTILNLLRCCVQLGSINQKHPVVWNTLWLLNRFGMVLLEVSVVVFLLHGYLYSGRKAILYTLYTSGGVATFDTLVKALYIFAFHIPLFMFGGTVEDGIQADMHWSKWGFWLAHTLLFTLIYSGILVLPYTQWRDLLPAKPSFHRYILTLVLLNFLAFIGSILIGSHVVAGYCLFGISNWLYWAFYPPLLYVTFLADFFSEESFDLDLMYYSEMLEAGCFDDT